MLLADLEDGLALALQFPQRVRHGDVGERQVVPARRLDRIAVVGAEQRVDVVGAGAASAGTRARYQRQVGRVHTEPCLGLGGVDGRLHHVAHLAAGEQQVVLNLLFAQADVPQAVVAHEGGRVAVQAVVDENLRAVLQRAMVVDLAGRLVPGDAPGGGMGTRHQAERQGSAKDQFLPDVHVVISSGLQCGLKVTRSGTGLGVPSWLHHGISRKKPK